MLIGDMRVAVLIQSHGSSQAAGLAGIVQFADCPLPFSAGAKRERAKDEKHHPFAINKASMSVSHRFPPRRTK
jgi:hypothetical protein